MTDDDTRRAQSNNVYTQLFKTIKAPPVPESGDTQLSQNAAAAASPDETTVIHDGRTPIDVPLAWSDDADDDTDMADDYDDDDDDGDDVDDDDDDDYEPKLSRRQRDLVKWLRPDDEVWTDEDDAAYSRGTVKMFVGLIAVAVIAAGWMIYFWQSHRNPPPENPGPSWVTHQVPTLPPPAAAEAPPTSVTVTVTATPTAEAPPPAPELTGVDAHFIAFIRTNDGGGKYADVSDERLIKNAHLACTDLENKSGFDNVAINLDLSNGGVAWFADTATANYCPQLGGNV